MKSPIISMFIKLVIISGLLLLLPLALSARDAPKPQVLKESLGEQLFNDISLSKDGTQACASCHDAKHAFMDSRINETSADATTPGAVSKGQDASSLGDINVPAITYAAFIPAFHFDAQTDTFKGGLFLNGREASLADQAKQPFLNPVEMQTSKYAVVEKVKSNYAQLMKDIYGSEVFSDVDTAFNAVADSIAAFERTPAFASFDSKFDKVLREKAEFSREEAHGLDLFIDENKGNCAACHPLISVVDKRKMRSLFTDYSYDNLGVPANTKARKSNNMPDGFIDNALYDNPAVDNAELKGAYRVPSLRNVAVSAPYMHNGVFNELTTVLHFYNSRDVAGAVNPETSQRWQPGEVESTKNKEELGDLGLSEQEIAALVAFLKTLTDERYEGLIPDF